MKPRAWLKSVSYNGVIALIDNPGEVEIWESENRENSIFNVRIESKINLPSTSKDYWEGFVIDYDMWKNC